MSLKLVKTSVGKKAVVSITGLILLGFVVAHLIGNLQIFLGPEWLNGYAEHLDSIPYLLWPARLVLLFSLILHMSLSLQLASQNRQARPARYIKEDTVQATLVSRHMVIAGLGIFLFIIYHLLHFTFGKVHAQYSGVMDAAGDQDVYSMIILSFRQWPIALTYITAMFILSAHLRHASYSFLQTLGFTPEGKEFKVRSVGHIFGWLIFFGFASIPFCSIVGLLKPVSGGG